MIILMWIALWPVIFLPGCFDFNDTYNMSDESIKIYGNAELQEIHRKILTGEDITEEEHIIWKEWSDLHGGEELDQ